MQPTRVHDVDGTWLHAEQSGAMRDGGTYGLWVSAVKAAVDPVVVDGKEAPGEESGRGEMHILADAEHLADRRSCPRRGA